MILIDILLLNPSHMALKWYFLIWRFEAGGRSFLQTPENHKQSNFENLHPSNLSGLLVLSSYLLLSREQKFWLLKLVHIFCKLINLINFNN
jgi:hypothetical protein